MKSIKSEVENHVVCHNNTDIIHYVVINKGNVLQTELPFVEEFSTSKEAKIRINEIAKDENYFSNNFE